MQINQCRERNGATIARLLTIWEGAVRATHDFLTEEDIQALLPEVRQGVGTITQLYLWRDEDGVIQGFLGVEKGKIEMLFVDAAARGQGVGKALALFAVEELGARLVDVNEQNTQGVGFCHHLGFQRADRSERDSAGRPFPLLHLYWRKGGSL